MKKIIDINDEDMTFLADYKKSHGVSTSSFIDMAIRKEIIRVKQEIKLQEHVSNK